MADKSVRRCAVFLGASWLVLFLSSACQATASTAGATPIPFRPTATRVAPSVAPTATVLPAAAPSATPTRLVETVKIKIKLDTYEASETIGAELSKAKGIVGVFVSETEIVVNFDPQLTNLREIIQLINQNPEVHTIEP